MDDVCGARARWVNTQIGLRLQAALHEAGMLEADLARFLEVPEAKIVAFCKGLERMSPEVMVRSCEFLGQSVIWFFSFDRQQEEFGQTSTAV
jgi:plasmid maintenance system antidote protein VapI